MNHPRRGGFFFTISPAAGAAGELKQNPKKKPNMAKRNTNPGIGETTDSGVMYNPQPSRARTRGMSYGDINIARTALFDKINR